MVVISHGGTGSFLGHRDTAQALADVGFVVAAISRPGDNAQDCGHTNELSVFVDRPADIKRLVDYMLGAWSNASAIDAERIGLFGFSRGGNTGLVALGAKTYRFGRRIGVCAGQTNTLCEQVREGRLEPLAHHGRIKAAVIADPLSVAAVAVELADEDDCPHRPERPALCVLASVPMRRPLICA